jgi:serine acetyltransferase
MYLSTIKPFLVVSFETLMSIVLNLPRYSVFLFLKKKFLSLMGARIGRGVIIYPGVWIISGRNLVIEDDVVIGVDGDGVC